MLSDALVEAGVRLPAETDVPLRGRDGGLTRVQ